MGWAWLSDYSFPIYFTHLRLVSARLITASPCHQASSAEFTAVKCRHASRSLNLFWDPIFYLWKPALSAGWTSLWGSKLVVTWCGSQHATLITALPSDARQGWVEERVKAAFSISCNYSWPIVSEWKLTICSHLVGWGEWRGFIAFLPAFSSFVGGLERTAISFLAAVPALAMLG